MTRIAVCGAGPAGLYFALLARLRLGAEVTVFEQGSRDATYGFGIVLANRALDRLKAAHRSSHDEIAGASLVSRDRLISLRGKDMLIEGGDHGRAIARLTLLGILRRHAEDAGVRIVYGERLEDPGALEVDLLVGADGVRSIVRQQSEDEFGVSRRSLTCRLAWYGTGRAFPNPLLSFKTIKGGHFWCAAYSYSETMSTFVAECDQAAWTSSGLARLDERERKALAEEIFAEELRGHPLISNGSAWHSMTAIRVDRWHTARAVLIGDALQSAHPSIGSGTRMAMEDAIALVDALVARPSDMGDALQLFREVREPSKLKLLEATDRSIDWYEAVGAKINELDLQQFALDFLQRTGRLSPTRLQAEYPTLLEG